MTARRSLKKWFAALCVLHGIVVCAGFFAPYDPAEQDRRNPYLPPMRLHLQDTRGQVHLRPFGFLRIVERTSRNFSDKQKAADGPARVYPADAAAWEAGRVAAILLGGIVGRKKLRRPRFHARRRGGGGTISLANAAQSSCATSCGFADPPGSRSKSAASFPNTKKIVENRIAPTTTYKSRERIDSEQTAVPALPSSLLLRHQRTA